MTQDEYAFTEFLKLFVYYLCSRCEQGAHHHEPQEIPDGSGNHCHNGEILHLLDPVNPAPYRLFAAFNEYQRHDPPAYIHAQLAQAYNTATPHRKRTNPILERSVEYVLANTRRTWLKHGCEQPEEMHYEKNAAFPPLHTRSHVGSMGTTHRDAQAFAVDTDTWPFLTCSTHPLDSTAPWGYISGYIPLTRFSGELLQPADRDHYYARGEVPTHQWLFVYKDIPESEQALHNNLQDIRNQKLMTLHVDTIKYLYTLTTKLQNISDVKRHSAKA